MYPVKRSLRHLSINVPGHSLAALDFGVGLLISQKYHILPKKCVLRFVCIDPEPLTDVCVAR